MALSQNVEDALWQAYGFICHPWEVFGTARCWHERYPRDRLWPVFRLACIIHCPFGGPEDKRWNQ